LALDLFFKCSAGVTVPAEQDTPVQEDSVSQFVMSRHEFAGVMVVMAISTVPLSEPGQARRVVDLGWISRRGGLVAVPDRLAGPSAAPVTAGR